MNLAPIGIGVPNIEDRIRSDQADTTGSNGSIHRFRSSAPVAVQVVRATAAWRLLEDEAFVAEWATLQDQCPWATAFQGPAFLRTWLASYRQVIEPVVILSRNAAGNLTGLLVLARRNNGELIPAGDVQAEYQAWICLPEIAEHFPPAAITSVRRELPASGLVFKYLPPATPLDWTSAPGMATLLTPHRRPLLRFGDGTEIEASLRRGTNRSKLNRLKRLGKLEVRQVTDSDEFDRLFDRMIEFYDLRHGAIHGTAAFNDDPRKTPFHQAMMRVRGLLHVSVMTAGDEIAAAHLGVRSGPELQLGIIVHNPLLAKHSPGTLHILLLSQMLRELGMTQLDLTPGGDAYKESFANAWDQVHTLVVYGSDAHSQAAAVMKSAKMQAKRLLDRVNISPARAETLTKDALQIVRQPKALVRRAAQWLRSDLDSHLYDCMATVDLPEDAEIRRDCIADLLLYQPAGAGPTRRAFLSAALDRLRIGQHCFTARSSGRLVACAWLADRPDGTTHDGLPDELHLPADASLAYGFHIDSSDASRWAKRLIAAMAGAADNRRLVAILPADYGHPTSAPDNLRLERSGTISLRTRFGRRNAAACLSPSLITAGTPPVPGQAHPSAVSRVEDTTPA